jgi:hypothetical protein
MQDQQADNTMPVYLQQGLIFIHIPKTGGESVSAALSRAINTDKSWTFNQQTHCGPIRRFLNRHKPDLVRKGKHATAMQIMEIIGNSAYNNAYKFCIVRNPWDQAVSFYHHLRKPLHMDGIREKLLKPRNACRLALEHDFPDWVEAVYHERQVQEEASRKHFPVDHFCNQSDWLLGTSGQPVVDFVCRFENLKRDLEAVENKIGLQFTEHLPHHNRSVHGHYSGYYNLRSRNIIENHFSRDIELFGYTFESDPNHWHPTPNT